ncbi:MAG: hypothetical protein ACT4P1_11260 [Sporichthyaceae bacterium]
MRLWQREVALAAQALASLLTRGPSEVDLDVVVTARAAVLDHVAHVLGDLVPRTRPDRPRIRHYAVPLARVEADPIGGLALVLQGRGRPHMERSPSELFDNRRPVGPSTADWVEVGRRALLAGRCWGGPTVGNLEPDVAWDVLTEIAGLAEAIAVLDTDLGAVAGQRPDVHALVAATAGLRVAARETLALAAPNGDASQPAVAEASSAPIVTPAAGIAARASRNSTLARDTRRLTILLDQSTEVTPHHSRACAQVSRDLCILAAGTASSVTGGDLRQELGDVARALHAAATRDRGEFALNPVAAPALELQLRDLHASTRLAFATGVTLDPVDANRLARRLPDLVEILADKALAQVEHGHWAVPDRSEGATLPYAFASTSDAGLTPPMLPALRQAAGAADVLRHQVAHSASATAANPALSAAVGTLSPVVQERAVANRRPAHPAQSPTRRLGTGISR